jgi:transcriptional regulator with XRE-family HTH domain
VAGYSIEQVALTCGLTETEIAKVEAGHEGDRRLVKRIAKALGITATALFPTVAA